MAANALQRLDLALEASNEGIWDWDFASSTFDCTDRVGEFFGCAKEDVPNIFERRELIHPEDQELFQSEIEAVKSGALEVLAVEPRVLTQDDEGKDDWKYFRVRGVPVMQDGKLTGLAGSLIDISQRKRAEQALLAEQHLTKTLVENVPLQIYFKDTKSRFTMVNSPMAKWLGEESPQKVIGKTDADFFDEAHWRQTLEDEQEILKSGKALESVIEKESWSGKEDTWVLTTKMPYRDRRGELKGTFGVSSDVSELVNTQRSLAEIAAKLKERNQAYEEEMALAKEIQQGQLPSIYPKIRDAEFAHRYLPISGLAGDFFIVTELSEDQVGILVSDVMGHGVRSALIANLLRGLADQAGHCATEPGKFLQTVNDGLVTFLKQAGVTMFATAFYAVVDYQKGELRYGTAGHPSGIITRAEGISLLEFEDGEKGPGLGLVADATYGEGKLDIEGVEKLLLFTDGVYEVENAEREPYLHDRLLAIVKEKRGLPLEELLDMILENVKSFTGGSGFEDDVCLVGMAL